MHKLIMVMAGVFCVLAVNAQDKCRDVEYWDHSVDEFPALPGETDDQPRLQRAVHACANKVLFVPAGDYKFDRTLVVTNYCSVLMHKRARFIADKPMEYVVKVNFSPLYKPGGMLFEKCASGNLLMLAPIAWPYQVAEKSITRMDALILTRIAQMIARDDACEIDYKGMNIANVDCEVRKMV